MKWLIVILLVIVLLVWKRNFFDIVDKGQEEFLKKDGRATFIRTNWPNLVERVAVISSLSIKKERDDAVIIGDADVRQVYLGQDMGRLSVIYISKRQIIQKWIFDKSTSTEEIINQICHYIK